jgi:hypothetical protein
MSQIRASVRSWGEVAVGLWRRVPESRRYTPGVRTRRLPPGRTAAWIGGQARSGVQDRRVDLSICGGPVRRT